MIIKCWIVSDGTTEDTNFKSPFIAGYRKDSMVTKSIEFNCPYCNLLRTIELSLLSTIEGIYCDYCKNYISKQDLVLEKGE